MFTYIFTRVCDHRTPLRVRMTYKERIGDHTHTQSSYIHSYLHKYMERQRESRIPSMRRWRHQIHNIVHTRAGTHMQEEGKILIKMIIRKNRMDNKAGMEGARGKSKRAGNTCTQRPIQTNTNRHAHTGMQAKYTQEGTRMHKRTHFLSFSLYLTNLLSHTLEKEKKDTDKCRDEIMHIFTDTHIRIFTRCTITQTRMYTFTYVHTTYICKYIRTYIDVHTYIRLTYARENTCTYDVHMYIRTYDVHMQERNRARENRHIRKEK